MNTRRIILALILAILLFPVQALAGICFQVTPGPIFVVLELQGQPAGPFYNLVGAADFGQGAVVPLNGSAYVRQDGTALFGMIVHTSVPAGVGGAPQDFGPIEMWGILAPPSFTSGSGLMHVTDFGGGAVSFASAACPSMP